MEREPERAKFIQGKKQNQAFPIMKTKVENVLVFELQSIQIIDCNFAIRLIELSI